MDLDTFSTLTVIAAVAVIAPLISEVTRRRVPGVVLEIAFVDARCASRFSGGSQPSCSR